jgi:protein gp37
MMMMMMMNHNKPVSPTWAEGGLFRGARFIHINRAFLHIPLQLRSPDFLVMGRKHLYYVDIILDYIYHVYYIRVYIPTRLLPVV